MMDISPAQRLALASLIERTFVEPPAKAAVRELEGMLGRGIVGLENLSRVFDHLDRCGALPRSAETVFVRHFGMWLEIVNHARFIPIITAPGRLDALGSLLQRRLRGGRKRDGMVIVDVGTGQPPYTTVDLAARFSGSMVHGFDLYRAQAIVWRPDGAYAVFDERGELRGVHCRVPERLHAMVLAWEDTCAEFEGRREVLQRLGDAEGWRLTDRPIARLLEGAREPNVQLHSVEPGDFSLAPIADESVDVIWSFNCLLHYPDSRDAELARVARRCRVGGVVMEGYTSPSGGHAVYQVWERAAEALVPAEFGWSLTNLRRPLWPLAGHDPQVARLAKLLAWAKQDPMLSEYTKAPKGTMELGPEVARRLGLLFERRGLPTKIVDGQFVTHDTREHPDVLDLQRIFVA